MLPISASVMKRSLPFVFSEKYESISWSMHLVSIVYFAHADAFASAATSRRTAAS